MVFGFRLRTMNTCVLLGFFVCRSRADPVAGPRMNRCVPDFDMDDDYLLPSLTRPRKSQVAGDEIMELLWQNGPVVMQSHRSAKKSEPSDNGGDDLIAADQATPSSIQNQTHHYHQQQQQQQQQHNLFMQEDEMASWLHYPLNDTSFVADFCSDLLYPSPCVNAAAATTSTVSAATATRTAPVVEELRRQPPPKPPMPMAPSRRFDNFGHFSRLNRPRVDESGPSNSSRPVNESAVVDSSGTPAVGPGSRVSETLQYDVSRGTVDGGASADGGGREMATCELTVNSSPGASSACAEPPPPQKSSTTRPPPPPPPPPEDRKRKGIEIEIEIEADADADADADDCHSEDVELESADTKKQTRGSTSTKRSRAAEVHNLSERRRRDRINEKMRALQELIPHCNKADKASMLDEAIEYLKSLQMQVQMMSVGCSVVPMMFPGVHQYMPHMGMGIGMAMGMNRAMLPFPNMLPGSALPTPAAGAHLGPRFPMPTFHMPHVPAPDPSRISPTIQSDPLLSSLALQSQNQARIPNFIDPYQQYYGLRHMQLPLQQNQTPSGTGKPSTSKVLENLEKPPSG